MSDPIDPATGRVKLGGRAQRANERWQLCRWVPIRYPFGGVTHLLATSGRTFGEVTVCGRNVDRALPATTVRPLCEHCLRLVAKS